MILDKGLCAIYRRRNVAQPGGMPEHEYTLLAQGWYGELSFETAPARPTEGREEVRTDARIRILQNRDISNLDRVVLDTASGDRLYYRVTRAYHGFDADSGEEITDLNLEVTEP